MYISVKLSSATEQIIEEVRMTLFSEFSFIAKGTVISRAIQIFEEKKAKFPDPDELSALNLCATLPTRLNLTAQAANFIKDCSAKYKTSKTVVIHAVLSTVLSMNESKTKKPLRLRIISLNVNDFGGQLDHLMEHKNKDGNIDWEYWNNIDKSKQINKIISFIQEENPDIIFFQEFEVNNSKDVADFIMQLQHEGYVMKGNLQKDVKASMTVCFVQSSLLKESLAEEVDLSDKMQKEEYRSGRDYRIKIADSVLWGVHVPPRYDKKYWDKLIKTCELLPNVVLLGDFNTFSYANSKENTREFEELLLRCQKKDIWNASANSEVSTCGDQVLDHVVASESSLRSIYDMKIIHNTFSDHAALIVDMCCP